MPHCILSYSTLVTLRLRCFDIQIPQSIVSFPHLNSIDLQVIFPDSEAAVNRLLSCCPVLKKLHLFGFLDDVEVLKIDISVSTLRKLDLQLIETGSNNRKKHDIIIDAPNLEYLYIDDDSVGRYVVKNLSLISNVFVNYESFGLVTLEPAYNIHLLELFKGIAATRILTLFLSTVEVLGSALSYDWPTFPYLMTLVLHLSSFSGWTCFSKVLHCCPSLKVLILDLEGINDVDNRPSGDDDDLYKWTPPNSVPNCLLGHLELIGIQKFEGNKDELQVVEYVLNNAQMLECLMIGCDPDFMNVEVLEKLMTFSRASKACDVEIYERVQFEINEFDSIDKVMIWGV